MCNKYEGMTAIINIIALISDKRPLSNKLHAYPRGLDRPNFYGRIEFSSFRATSGYEMLSILRRVTLWTLDK